MNKNIWIIIAIAIAAIMLMPKKEAGPPTSVYYPLDGNVLDANGNYNGINHGVTFVDGKIGMAGDFEKGEYSSVTGDYAEEDYIELPNSNQLIPNKDSWSITLWFNQEATAEGEGALQMLISMNKYASPDSQSFFIHSTTGNLLIYWSGNIPESIELTPQIITGKWYHVAVTYDGTVRRIYLDNELISEKNATFSGFGNGHAYIGAYGMFNGDIIRTWDGLIDDVRIYNYPLSSSDVTDLYGCDYNCFTEAKSNYALGGVFSDFMTIANRWASP